MRLCRLLAPLISAVVGASLLSACGEQVETRPLPYTVDGPSFRSTVRPDDTYGAAALFLVATTWSTGGWPASRSRW